MRACVCFGRAGDRQSMKFLFGKVSKYKTIRQIHNTRRVLFFHVAHSEPVRGGRTLTHTKDKLFNLSKRNESHVI